jgi:hypothetical protein
MSSFIKELKNPKTGKIVKAFCLDDYFGHHKYGYGFRRDGKDVDPGTEIRSCDFYKEEEIEWK